MRKSSYLPSDWEKHVVRCIWEGRFALFRNERTPRKPPAVPPDFFDFLCEPQSIVAVVGVQEGHPIRALKRGDGEVGASGWGEIRLRRRHVFRMLRMEELEDAAEILWKKAKNRPEIRGAFPRLIYEVLLGLSRVLMCSPSQTKRFYQNLIFFLEYARDNSRRFRRGEPRVALERAIADYRLDEEEAPKTRPKKPGPRLARIFLKNILERTYGRPVDNAAAILLKVAYPETNPTAETVQRRRREQKKEKY